MPFPTGESSRLTPPRGTNRSAVTQRCFRLKATLREGNVPCLTKASRESHVRWRFGSGRQLAPLAAVGESFVVDAEQVQDRRVQIISAESSEPSEQADPAGFPNPSSSPGLPSRNLRFGQPTQESRGILRQWSPPGTAVWPSPRFAGRRPSRPLPAFQEESQATLFLPVCPSGAGGTFASFDFRSPERFTTHAPDRRRRTDC